MVCRGVRLLLERGCIHRERACKQKKQKREAQREEGEIEAVFEIVRVALVPIQVSLSALSRFHVGSESGKLGIKSPCETTTPFLSSACILVALVDCPPLIAIAPNPPRPITAIPTPASPPSPLPALAKAPSPPPPRPSQTCAIRLA